jgi:16S rRNA (guanine1207-N2)-methyltransferase
MIIMVEAMNRNIEINIKGENLIFTTEPGLFSPTSADIGSLAMLDFVNLKEGQKILDLGCGYGLVGIFAARKTGPDTVWMLDINPSAIKKSQLNANENNVKIAEFICSDGPEILLEKGLSGSFDFILCNPPYHTDFSVARRFIEAGYRLLSEGGNIVLVVKRLAWYRNKIKKVFGGIRVELKDSYYILSAQKRSGKAQSPGSSDRTPQTSNRGTRKHRKKITANTSKKRKNRRSPV